MGAYILKRLLLVIPTLLGIMIINFVLIQFVPGGPIDQIIAQMEGGGDVFEGISGGGSEIVENDSDSVASRGLPQEFLDELQVEFNFARIVCDVGFTGEPDLRADACNPVPIPAIERFFLMMWDYMRFDFGESYFRSVSVVDLVLEKMPVSITPTTTPSPSYPLLQAPAGPVSPRNAGLASVSASRQASTITRFTPFCRAISEACASVITAEKPLRALVNELV